MYKIILGKKNSPWKVSQNPLKGNWYTDIVHFKDFENDRKKFLKKYTEIDLDDISNWLEADLIWSDSVHIKVTFDIDDYKEKFGEMSKHKFLNRDFMVVYDDVEKEFYFFSISQIFSDGNSNKSYNKIEYDGELDVFFQYGIQNILTNKQVNLLRSHSPNEWCKDNDTGAIKPNVDIDSELGVSEGLELNGSKIISDRETFFDENKQQLLLVLQLQQKEVRAGFISKLNIGTYRFQADILMPNTIDFNSSKGETNLVTRYLYFPNFGKDNNEVSTNTIWETVSGVANNNISIIKPKIEKQANVTVSKINYLLQDKYIGIVLDMKNVDDKEIYNELKNSPQLLKIIPVNGDIFVKEIEVDLLVNNPEQEKNTGNDIKSEIGLMTSIGNGEYRYGIESNNWKPYQSKVGWRPDDYGSGIYLAKTYKIKFCEDIPIYENFVITDFKIPSLSPTYDTNLKSKYKSRNIGKMYNSTALEFNVVDSQLASFTIRPELMKNSSEMAIFHEKVIAIDQTTVSTRFIPLGGLHIYDSVYFNSSRKSPYRWNTSNNLQNFRNVDSFKEFVLNNSNGVNEEYKQAKQRREIAKTTGSLQIASGVLQTLTGSLAMAKGIVKPDMGSQLSGGNSIIGGIGGIIGGINTLAMMNNELNSMGAKMRDRNSNVNNIAANGTEIDTYTRLDMASFESLEFQTWKLPNVIYEKLAMYYNQFGVEMGGKLVSPLDYIHTHQRFNFMMIEPQTGYNAINAEYSALIAQIITLSLAMGVRIWHWDENMDDFEIGNYEYNNPLVTIKNESEVY